MGLCRSSCQKVESICPLLRRALTLFLLCPQGPFKWDANRSMETSLSYPARWWKPHAGSLQCSNSQLTPRNAHAANLQLIADTQVVPTVTGRRTALLNSAKSVCSKAQQMKWLLLEPVMFGPVPVWMGNIHPLKCFMLDPQLAAHFGEAMGPVGDYLEEMSDGERRTGFGHYIPSPLPSLVSLLPVLPRCVKPRHFQLHTSTAVLSPPWWAVSPQTVNQNMSFLP